MQILINLRDPLMESTAGLSIDNKFPIGSVRKSSANLTSNSRSGRPWIPSVNAMSWFANESA